MYIDWRENSQRYFHTLQALDVSPTCDAADVKSIIKLFPHSSQHVTGNSSHGFSDTPLQIIDNITLRDFLSIRIQDMNLMSVVFVKYIYQSVYFFLNNPVYGYFKDFYYNCQMASLIPYLDWSPTYKKGFLRSVHFFNSAFISHNEKNIRPYSTTDLWYLATHCCTLQNAHFVALSLDFWA
jgi:hypothetical protein